MKVLFKRFVSKQRQSFVDIVSDSGFHASDFTIVTAPPHKGNIFKS